MKKKQWINKQEAVLIIFFLTLFLASRLVSLTNWPIFTDEAIYLRWAQIAKNDASWRFISLTDGKQPLFVWASMVVMKIFEDPLLAGRLVSVFSGLASMAGMFLLGLEIFQSKKIGFFSSLFYLICPFALMYDRMALMDSLVACFSVWSLYFQVLLVKTLRIDAALLLGMIMGGGILTKSSGFFNIYLLPFSLLLFDWRRKKRYPRFFKWLGLALLAVFLSQAYYSVLRLSPWFHMISKKDTTFVYPFVEWIKHPFRFFWGNLKGQFDWLVTYLTWPVFLLVLGAFFSWRQKTREKLLLFIWFFAPFLALALFAKVLYPRFILFMTMPLLVLAAWPLNNATVKQCNNKIVTKLLTLSACCLVFIYPLYVDAKIIFDPQNAPIPESDLNQYINDWPAGGGVKEVIEYLKKEAQKGPIFVATEGTFGLFPAALELYLVDDKNIIIKGYWPLDEEVIKELEKQAFKTPTFLILKETQEKPQDWPLKLIFKIRKGKGNSFLHLYQYEFKS